MKTIRLITVLTFLLLFASCNGQTKPIGEEKPKIDFIITNDYMSERNLSFMGGPVPANYNKGIIDSLGNCFVEQYENDTIIKKKFYNKHGMLYYSEQYFYDSKNRLEKTFEIDEYKEDTCVIHYQYRDSLNLIKHKKITNRCKTERVDYYYQYNEKGEKAETIVNINDTLSYKILIQDISKYERHIKSYDKDNRLSTYLYRYNDKDLVVFEKHREWDYVIKGDYFETGGEYEYLYKYDKNGNWIERTKQTYCPPKKSIMTKAKSANQKKTNKDKPVSIEVDDFSDCRPEIKEQLIRKIYYK